MTGAYQVNILDIAIEFKIILKEVRPMTDFEYVIKSTSN